MNDRRDVNMFSLKGEKAIVTGGTRGLGMEIARAYHDAGADVVLWGRSPQGADVARQMGEDQNNVFFVQCDLSDSAQISPAEERSLELRQGRVDILVNGAGDAASHACAGLRRGLLEKHII